MLLTALLLLHLRIKMQLLPLLLPSQLTKSLILLTLSTILRTQMISPPLLMTIYLPQHLMMKMKHLMMKMKPLMMILKTT
jgi:hypothetical protein